MGMRDRASIRHVGQRQSSFACDLADALRENLGKPRHRPRMAEPLPDALLYAEEPCSTECRRARRALSSEKGEPMGRSYLAYVSLSFVIGCTQTVISNSDAASMDAGVEDDGGGMPDGQMATDSGACSSKSCAGCCDVNGVCQNGTDWNHCGKGGGACKTCPGVMTCLFDGTCGIDPNSTWKVQPLSATISTKNGNADWDFGAGAPDPFVQLWCPATAVAVTSTTSAASDTFMPMWSNGSCTMKAGDLLATGYGVAVFDEDVSVHDVISSKGTIKPTENTLVAGSENLTNNGNLVTMKMGYTKQ